MKDAAAIALVAIVAIGGIVLMLQGFKKSEINECKTWQLMARQYENFYLTRWQAEQCTRHGIEVDAPLGLPLLNRMGDSNAN